MAERRMFSAHIVSDDRFIELPAAAQALYMHLAMVCDDDGFTNKTKVCLLQSKAKAKDLNLLVENGYLIRFESGVVCIKHWLMQNAIRKDRYVPTVYQQERCQLYVHKPGVYSFNKTDEKFDSEDIPQNKKILITCV